MADFHDQTNVCSALVCCAAILIERCVSVYLLGQLKLNPSNVKVMRN